MCCERQHAVARELSCDSERISDRNFRGRKILRSKSREIAPISMPPGIAQLAHDLSKVPNICCERQHAVAREILGDLELISDRNFRKFSRPQHFAFEIARDRAEIRAAW